MHLLMLHCHLHLPAMLVGVLLKLPRRACHQYLRYSELEEVVVVEVWVLRHQLASAPFHRTARLPQLSIRIHCHCQQLMVCTVVVVV